MNVYLFLNLFDNRGKRSPSRPSSPPKLTLYTLTPTTKLTLNSLPLWPPSLLCSPPLKESHRIHFPGTNEETVWIINTYQPFIYDYYGQDTAAAVIAASAAITTSAGKIAAVKTQIPAGKYVSNFI